MANATQLPQSDLVHHTQKIKIMLTEIITQCREDVPELSDVNARALFEATADVLTGLRKTYDDLEQRSEPAWQKMGPGGLDSSEE